VLKKAATYSDLSFLLRFILLFLPLYYFNIFFLGITDPKNYYNSFLDENLNYIKWVTFSINYVASIFTGFFGIDSIVAGKQIFVEHGASVLLEFSCLGFGISSFWIAFVIAHKASVKSKLLWCLGGVCAIWFLNCWRIAILLIALEKKWPTTGYLDHHGLFNLCSYLIIGLLIHFFLKRNEKYELTLSV